MKKSLRHLATLFVMATLVSNVAFSIHVITADDKSLPENSAAKERISITGRVVTDNGEPVPDAHIWLGVSSLGLVLAEGAPVIAEGTTATDGTFQLSLRTTTVQQFVVCEFTQFTIWVYKPGREIVAYTTRRILPTNPVEIQLAAAPEFEITLHDADGTPAISTSTTPIVATFGETRLSLPQPLREMITAYTDLYGKAKLSGLRLPQIRNLVFSDADHGRQTYYSREGLPIETSLTLMPVGSLEGRLEAPDDTVVDFTKFQVRLGTSDPNLNDPDESWSGSATVSPDREGRFSIPTIGAGTVNVFVAGPEDNLLHADPSRQRPVVLVDGKAELSVPLRRTIPVKQWIYDADSREPIRDCSVHFQYNGNDVVARPDSTGCYRARLLPGATYHPFVLHADQYIRHQSPASFEGIKIPEDATEFEVEPLEFRRGRFLEGMAIDAAGKPMAHVYVGLNKEPTEEGEREPRGTQGFTWTDIKGKFQIRGIEPNINLILSFARGGVELGERVRMHAQEQQPVILQARPFEFASLSGSVQDQFGDPVEGAKVYIYIQQDGKPQYACRVYSSADGTYISPPHLIKGVDYRVTIIGAKEDFSSAWHPLSDAEDFPTITVNREKLGNRKHKPHSTIGN